MRRRTGTGSAVGDLRYYQARWLLRRSRLVLYAFFGCGFAIVMLGLWSERSGFPWGWLIALGVPLGAIVIWVEKIGMRTGLEELRSGYAYHDSFGTEVIPFSQVVRFEARRQPGRRGTGAVFLVQRHGARQVLGLVQGRPTGWAGGETDDIVGLLNARHDVRAAAVAATE